MFIQVGSLTEVGIVLNLSRAHPGILNTLICILPTCLITSDMIAYIM